MNTRSSIGVLLLGVFAIAIADHHVDTRGGSCADAKKQHEYYCEGKGDPNDIFTQANIACNNAKRNVAAACEGKVEADAEYKFESDGQR